MPPTIRVVETKAPDNPEHRLFVATFQANGVQHTSGECKTLHEGVGRLACDHPDLLRLTITLQDLATNPRAEEIELQPSCWCAD